MERWVKKFFFNASSNKVVVTIKSAPCPPDSTAARLALAEVLQNCVTNPQLLDCDTRTMEKATIVHDGDRWVLVAEAIVPKNFGD